MKAVVVAAAVMWASCGWSGQRSTGTLASNAFALVHANVVDVERGSVVSDRTILISGTRILSVESSSRARLPAGTREIDASGAYVLPGLWDMHAHVLGNFEQTARVLIPNGVTGVRHPGNDRLDTLRAVRARLRSATAPLPRLIAAGVLIDGPAPARPAGSLVLTRADEAARLADSLLASGVDFFKSYSRIRREPFLALAREAKSRGVMLAGHVPSALTPEEIADAGMRSIEHVFEFPIACSTRESDMRTLRTQAEATSELRAVRMAISDTVLRSYDRAKCRSVISHLVRNGTFVTPTLYLYKRGSVSRETTPADSAAAQYFRGGVPDRTGPGLPELSVSAERSRAVYARLADIVREMKLGGLSILAGTDTPSPVIWTGFSLHDELQTLVEDAGFLPIEAIRAATLNAARYFAATDTMGIVSPGKVADLVLLAANPLSDIRNTRRVVGVVVNGRYLQRQDLDEMLALAARAARGQ